MKCEKCGTREATSQITSIVNGKKQEHHYCNECFLQVQPFGNIPKELNLPFMAIEEDFDGEEDDELNENGVPYEYADEEEMANGIPVILENIVMSLAGEIFDGDAADGARNPNQKSNAQRCPHCGLSLEDVRRTQKAGCAKCYQVFDAVLMKKYRRFSDGRNYSGKDYNPQLIWNDADHLQNELDIAVKNQNFELAARLRDGMKKLQKKASVE